MTSGTGTGCRACHPLCAPRSREQTSRPAGAARRAPVPLRRAAPVGWQSPALLDIVAAGIQLHGRAHRRQRPDRGQRVGIGGRAAGGRDGPRDRRQSLLPLGVVARDQLFHVGGRHQPRRRSIARLERGVRRSDVDDLGITQDEANECPAVPLERPKLERDRRAAGLRPDPGRSGEGDRERESHKRKSWYTTTSIVAESQ